jgi:hypothetical protein
MTHAQLADRLRGLAGQRPTYIFRELYALAHEVEQTPEPVAAISGPIADDDMEALVRATQPPKRHRIGLLDTLFGRRR